MVYDGNIRVGLVDLLRIDQGRVGWIYEYEQGWIDSSMFID